MTTPTLNRAARAEYRRMRKAPGMPAATHRGVHCDSGIRMAADDGTILLTDHWYAEDAGEQIVLIRTPYGRADISGIALFMARRGHHVVVQSCRGTFGSEGDFDPLRHEAADGQAALRWLRAQPWATGPVATWGGSYVGVTQWAYCSGEERPDSMGIEQSARRFDAAMAYPGGGFAIDTLLSWAFILTAQERSVWGRITAALGAPAALIRGTRAIPPADAVRLAYGTDLPFFRAWVEHSDAGDPWWEPAHFAERLDRIPPVFLVAGWQDLFLEGQLSDYATLREAGYSPRLVVGDWVHGAPDAAVHAVREALRGFAGETTAPVSVQITGGGGWRDFSEWPPPVTMIERELTAEGALEDVREERTEASLSYRYDPNDPTPASGGRTLTPLRAGRHIQLLRERRADVLLFTGEPLAGELLLTGVPEIELTLASTNPRVDLFVRLCEVDEKGISWTVTDGYRRLAPDAAPGAPRRVLLPLAPLAHRFAAGSRLRVQISSGAHPLYLRNSGTNDPIRDHSRLIPSDQTVLFGGEEPAILRLPVLSRGA